MIIAEVVGVLTESNVDPYSDELHKRAIVNRSRSAEVLVELVGLDESQLALECDLNEWLITRDFIATRKPNLGFVGALKYVEDLDLAKQLMPAGFEDKGE